MKGEEAYLLTLYTLDGREGRYGEEGGRGEGEGRAQQEVTREGAVERRNSRMECAMDG